MDFHKMAYRKEITDIVEQMVTDSGRGRALEMLNANRKDPNVFVHSSDQITCCITAISEIYQIRLHESGTIYIHYRASDSMDDLFFSALDAYKLPSLEECAANKNKAELRDSKLMAQLSWLVLSEKFLAYQGGRPCVL